ncbi:MAG: hypothetical protein WCG05_03275 [Alphaproteobacteria bacterium]
MYKIFYVAFLVLLSGLNTYSACQEKLSLEITEVISFPTLEGGSQIRPFEGFVLTNDARAMALLHK